MINITLELEEDLFKDLKNLAIEKNISLEELVSTTLTDFYLKYKDSDIKAILTLTPEERAELDLEEED